MDQNEEGLQYISDKNIPDLLEVIKNRAVHCTRGARKGVVGSGGRIVR